MPIAITEDQRALQASIRGWANRAGALEVVRGLESDPARADEAACWRGLVSLGVFSIALPVQAGGAGGAVADLAADHQAGLSRPGLVIGGWAVPAVIGHGTQAQCDRFVGPTLRGEISWCQLFSEPEAGSDLAAAGLADDPVTRERLGALVADGLAGSLMDLRSTLAQLSGADADQQAAVRKLVGVAHRQAVAETVLTLCGAEGAAADGAAADAVHEFLLTRCLSIAGGTTQILLSMVAERELGLPREEVR